LTVKKGWWSGRNYASEPCATCKASGKRLPLLKRWQIHHKRVGGNSLKSKQNKGIFIACLVVGFQAILRRKPITINIPLFPAGQASWLLFRRTARINSTKKLCFRHRASLRQSKTSLKRHASASATQTSAVGEVAPRQVGSGATCRQSRALVRLACASGAKLLNCFICFVSPLSDYVIILLEVIS
jgi:hypothetical protein